MRSQGKVVIVSTLSTMRTEVEVVLGRLVTWGLILVTLAVTPTWSIDPINPVKMFALTAFAFMLLAGLVVNHRLLELRRYKRPLILIFSFMSWQIVVFLVSGGEKMQQLFGTNGRNTGLITYFAFSIFFIVSMTVSSNNFFKKFLFASLVAGIGSLAYGVIQAVGADPFEWINPYSPVFGFLGNPNFHSSLLGILGSVVFTQLLSASVIKQIKALYVSYLMLTLYVIKESDSQQGFLVLFLGSAVSLGIFVHQKNKVLGMSYLGLGFLSFVAILAGSLNRGPLGEILYKESVAYRGDYWRAGWKMTVENPVFGVGLDSYGDWYRRSRSLEATLRRGPDVTSNAAHNVYLDISAYGGLPLLIIFIALTVLTAISAFKVLKRSTEFNAGFVGLIAGWVAFQAQSIISINQIGLAVWGWVLSGLIIGYEINTRGSEITVEKKTKKGTSTPVQSSASSVVAMFIGLLVGLLIGAPPYVATSKFKGSLETQNATVIQSAAYIWPVDAVRMIQVAIGLDQNKLGAQGLKVAVDASIRFPDNYSVWANLLSMDKATAQQKAQALAEMKRLDPWNPNLK